MVRKRFGFSIVEVAIVITVIAILATIGTFSFLAVQKQSRDSQREASATIISQALEKYYDENGEYPGCEAVTADPELVRTHTLKSIDTAVLKTPNAAANVKNSIVCQPLGSVAEEVDALSYSGDTSDACQTGPACSRWILTWRKETGGIGEIRSRRTAEAIATTPTITATAAGLTSINVSWTAAQDATSYQLQRSTTAGFSSPTTTTHTSRSTIATGLTPGTTYYFRVRAMLPSSQSGWSNVAQATTTTLTAPTGVSVSAVMSGSNARGIASGGSCQTGATIARQISVDGGAWQAAPANTLDVPAAEGVTYTFRARATCTANGQVATGTSSSPASVTRPVSTPTGLTMSAAMSGTNAVGSAGGGTCASGTTIERRIDYASSNTSSVGSYVGYSNGSTRTVAAQEGYRYTFRQQARCVGQNASSSWVTSNTADTVRPITTRPSAPSVSAATSGSTTTWTWNATTGCPSGTTARYQYRSLADWDYESAWYGPYTSYTSNSWNTQNQGYEYTRQIQTHCYTVHSTGPWSTTGSRSYIRPVMAPGAATNMKHSVASNRKSRAFTWTAPTCGPGARAESEYNSWIGNQSPAAGSSMHWIATGKNGWIYSTTYANRGYWSNTYTSTFEGDGTIPSNIEVRHRIRYICANATTGRQSAWGPATLSSIFKT